MKVTPALLIAAMYTLTPAAVLATARGASAR
jgi:hypothetical protein